MKEVFLIVRPYYGINIHTDAQGEYGTVLLSNDVFPDLPLINSVTMLDRSEEHGVIFIDAYTGGGLLPDELLEKISSLKYDKLIIKTTAATIRSDIELARQIKLKVPGSYIMAAGQAAKGRTRRIVHRRTRRQHRRPRLHRQKERIRGHQHNLHR